jgi:hypothetical protein
MTPDELKAELTQMAVENARLDEVVKLLNTAYCFMLNAPDEVEAYGLSGVYTTKNPVRAEGSDWCDRANALINPNPPTPSLGAAMLRVVEAAKELAGKDVHDAEKQWTLIEAVYALNEMEAKQ